jgi:3',5'-cyclic AMP phosphodiesterase CpdA
MKLLHISDIHLYALEICPSQFLTKKLFTNVNHLFHRAFVHTHTPLYELIEAIDDFEIESVIVSGDCTTTASKKEFALVKDLFEKIKQTGTKIYALPGNHDYEENEGFNTLSTCSTVAINGLTHVELSDSVDLILLDTTKNNQYLLAEGHFSHALEASLEKKINSIDSKKTILLANHFALYDYKKGKNLIGRQRLEALVAQYPNIKLYLHGHRHKHQITQNENLTVVDAGCICKKAEPSACLIDLKESSIELHSLFYQENRWKCDEKTTTISL